MSNLVTPFQCVDCGWKTLKWVGRCGGCQSWDTIEENSHTRRPKNQEAPKSPSDEKKAKPIAFHKGEISEHFATGVTEFDRVLGGGIVPGAVILLTGEPGVGKSTLLLEVAAQAAKKVGRVLYVSAEEAVGQVYLRASRTNAIEENLLLAHETELSLLLGQFESAKPKVLIVDSIQTMETQALQSSAGGVAQVREVAASLTRVAKESGVSVIMVGHVTKDGQLAGPRSLEHLVDVVCHFEGDRQTSLRFIRSLKNRFGPTDEVGCFEMKNEGIVEVSDPSSLFRSQTAKPISGTCTTIALEGKRALAVEIQALVAASSSTQPRRVVSGVDFSRVALVLAVLEKRAEIPLSSYDVYVSTVGGIKLSEPATDLAIAIAVASAWGGEIVSRETAVLGEISLAGEIRSVVQESQRRVEAGRLGFTNVIDSQTATISEALTKALDKANNSKI